MSDAEPRPALGPVSAFLAEDHQRLDQLLRRSDARPDAIDGEAFASFRAGLLRHIAMEEKVLLPEARRRRTGAPLEVAKQLRADHAALAALLVPAPSHQIVATIRRILTAHNLLEERPGGVYASCDLLAGAEAEALVARLRAVPAVRAAAYRDGPLVEAHVARVLRERSRDDG